jgi:hypothetical protein
MADKAAASKRNAIVILISLPSQAVLDQEQIDSGLIIQLCQCPRTDC